VTAGEAEAGCVLAAACACSLSWEYRTAGRRKPVFPTIRCILQGMEHRNRPQVPKRLIALVAGIAVIAPMSACGSSTAKTSASASATSSASTTASTSTTTSDPSTTAAATPTRIPANAVAIVAGVPITQASFNHWLFVAAKGQASGGPTIVPSDPPRFARCIAQARNSIPKLKKSSTAQLRADCRQLFTSLSGQTMDFLIKADWYESEAAQLKITPSAAEVDRTLKTDEQRQFPTKAGFQAFLKHSGQTPGDIRFRVLTNLIFTELVARQTGTQSARVTAATRQATQMFRSATRCARLYVMADCANYHAPA
jgi:hypothetical protein